jgi:hypothetical protein
MPPRPAARRSARRLLRRARSARAGRRARACTARTRAGRSAPPRPHKWQQGRPFTAAGVHLRQGRPGEGGDSPAPVRLLGGGRVRPPSMRDLPPYFLGCARPSSLNPPARPPPRERSHSAHKDSPHRRMKTVPRRARPPYARPHHTAPRVRSREGGSREGAGRLAHAHSPHSPVPQLQSFKTLLHVRVRPPSRRGRFGRRCHLEGEDASPFTPQAMIIMQPRTPA